MSVKVNITEPKLFWNQVGNIFVCNGIALPSLRELLPVLLVFLIVPFFYSGDS